MRGFQRMELTMIQRLSELMALSAAICFLATHHLYTLDVLNCCHTQDRKCGIGIMKSRNMVTTVQTFICVTRMSAMIGSDATENRPGEMFASTAVHALMVNMATETLQMADFIMKLPLSKKWGNPTRRRTIGPL